MKLKVNGMEQKIGSKTKVTLGLVISTFFEDIEDIKGYIQGDKQSKIIFTKVVPPFAKLWIKEGDKSNNEGGVP